MAKLTVLIATFIALLFVVDASIYRTTMIIDEGSDDTENPSRRGCSQQIQQQQNLRQCQEYIRQRVHGSRGRGRPAAAYDEVENQRDQFRRCCNQLQQMDSPCRCEGLRQAIHSQQSQGQIQGQDVRQAFQVAQYLPSECGVSPRRCQIQSSWWM
ncbi:hypothetical protein P3X46_027136 [Hevea brasiliensis]|uniref:Bifunctional inhibitor/plant lipid transfer protein/seed storage helical domain-containing protein n=1 Tax=Hevea brasiliensis TaxID=3981 RepID=A0ABQ9KYU3_HEVBR|nr:2S seed storage albumin protein-like [Hevea brasiliensis]KAJ9153723.1 hypothetical protein P3X46_027136 [Hevea brasiliensis]